MAALNFPTATADGQVFQADNGVIYTYQGTPPNGFWSATKGLDGQEVLDARYVEKSGDAMHGDLTFSTDEGGAVLTRIKDTGDATFGGNVGIGTTSPDALLTAKASSGKIARFRTADTNFFGIDIGTNGSNYTFIESVKGGTGSYQPLSFFVGGSRAVDIDTSGRLLVGTSTSAVSYTDWKLQVSGQTLIGSYLGATASAYSLNFIKSRSSSVGSYAIVSSGDKVGGLDFKADDGTDYETSAARIEAYVDGAPGTNDMPGRLVFSTTADGASSPTERMRIDSSGNVGVGTTSPSVKLDVVGTSGSSSVAEFSFTAGNSVYLKLANASNALGYIGYESSDLTFYNNNTERMRIDSSGRLLVGTTAYAQSTTAAFKGGYGSTTNPGRIALLRQYSAISGNNLNAEVGRIIFADDNGNGDGAQIRAEIDGTSWSTTSKPTRFTFFTTASSSVSPTERMRIDSSGRLLRGTSSARTNFYNAGTNSAYLLNEGTNYQTATIASICNSTTHGSYIVLARSRGASTGSNDIVQDDDTLGIIDFLGADGSRLRQGGRIHCEVDGTPGVGDMPGRLVFSTTTNGTSSPTERLRIANNGGISTKGGTGWAVENTSNLYYNGFGQGALIVNSKNGNTVLSLNQTFDDSTTRSAIDFYRNETEVGSITVSTTATTYNTSSDYRLKENVVEIKDGITRLMQLKPSRFNFIAEPSITVDGFIAHEAQVVVPEAVTGTKDEVDGDGNPVNQGIDQSKLVPLLTAALQEAITEIETLKQRLTDAGL